jgi:hypothetical protein
MSSDSIHDAVLCAVRRGRTPARSIDAALLVRIYSRNCDYLMIKCSLFPISINAGGSGSFGVFLSPLLSALAFLLPAFLRSPAVVINRTIKLLAAAGAIR